MNGKAVSNKRLKIQLKKGDEKPHMNNSSMMMNNVSMYNNINSNIISSDFINNVGNMAYSQDMPDMGLMGMNNIN